MDQCLVTDFPVVRMATRSSEVVYDDVRLALNEELPQVLDQWFREECSSLLYIVLLKDLIAAKSYLREVLLDFGKELFRVLFLFDNGWKENDDHHSECSNVHEARRKFEEVHEPPYLLAHPI